MSGRSSLWRHAAMSLQRLRRDDHGATAIEYGLICAAMAIAIIAAFPLLKEPLEATIAYIVASMGVV